MSITIHHGPNGSFKTAGVINDYFIPAALQGRAVVTNIRGVSRENTMLHMPDVPGTFDVITIDTDTREGRWQIATWFHWAPLGALLLFDESGVMFPKVWRDKDIEKLNYPASVLEYCDVATRELVREQLDSVSSAALDGRPANWVEAWEMHRHYNWDIVLTAPNIRSIRDDIRQTTEGAYKHKNKAVLGPLFKGYKEGYHDAQKNGQSASDFDVIRDKRVTDLTFRLYRSTKTGEHKQTLNGFNLFTSPRLMLAMGVAVLAFCYSIFSGGYQLLFDKADTSHIVDIPSGEYGNRVLLGQSGSSGSDPSQASEPVSSPADVPGSSAVEGDSLDRWLALDARFNALGGDVGSSDAVSSNGVLTGGPLDGAAFRVAAGIKKGDKLYYLIEVVQGKSAQLVDGADLQLLGYQVTGSDPCAVDVVYDSKRSRGFCLFTGSVAL